MNTKGSECCNCCEWLDFMQGESIVDTRAEMRTMRDYREPRQVVNFVPVLLRIILKEMLESLSSAQKPPFPSVNGGASSCVSVVSIRIWCDWIRSLKIRG